MITLRPDQENLRERCSAAFRAGHRRVLAVAPTGFGKTVMFSDIARRASARGHPVVIAAHRAELVDQIAGTLDRFEVPCGIIAPGYAPDGAQRVQVASVMTAVRRLDRLAVPHLFIPDEAHHCLVDNSWGRLLERWSTSFALGVTATPERLSGEGLGETFGAMVQGPGTAQLIADGLLSRYRLFAPPGPSADDLHTLGGDWRRDELSDLMDRSAITGDAVAHYQRLTPGRRAVAFCVSVQHAEHVAETFRAAGVSAQSIDGSMDRDERRRIVQDFSAGRIQVLTSCNLISEGFDCPAIEVAILLRPTQSLALYLQQVGRALRLFVGKTEAVILDHAGNCLRHGLPDDDRVWTLDGRRSRREKEDAEVHIVQCPKCYRIMLRGARVCECGSSMLVLAKPRKIQQQDGELREIERAYIDARRRELGSARSHDALVALERSRGYKSGYADHVEAAREEKRMLRETLSRMRARFGISRAGLMDLKPRELRAEIDALTARMASEYDSTTARTTCNTPP